jgi:hypothetical protein
MKTIYEMAKDCITVQDACNLSGVVHSFSRVISDLHKLLPNASTDEINRHPICVLYASKIASLAESDNVLDFSKAYQWALENSGNGGLSEEKYQD